MTAQPAPQLDHADLLRARLYALLAKMLMGPPSAALLASLATLDGDATPLGQALGSLGEAAAASSEPAARREHEALFIGVVRGEVVPYASYYQTGFLHDRPLARLRDDLQALGIERADGTCEPEDHLGTLCDIMAGLIAGAFAGAASLDAQHRFFDRHLRAWAQRCFADIEAAEAAALYRPVGQVGRLFLDIEAEAFALAAAPEPSGGNHERT